MTQNEALEFIEELTELAAQVAYYARVRNDPEKILSFVTHTDEFFHVCQRIEALKASK